MHSALERRTEAGNPTPTEGEPVPQWRQLDDEWDEACRLAGNPFPLRVYLAAHCGRGERPIGVSDGQSGRPLAGGILSADGADFRTYSFMPPEGTELAGGRLVEWLRTQGCSRLRLGSFYRGFEGQTLAQGIRAVQRLEFVHDLNLAPEQWWSALHSQHRRKLRRASKEGFRLSEIPGRQAAVLAGLSMSWSRRRGLRRNWTDLIRSWWRYRAMVGPLSRRGAGILYGLFRGDGELLSAAYMLETGSSAFYMIGASNEAGYRAGASFDLFWQLGRFYQERGLRWLNLGGVPGAARSDTHAEHGVYRFKSGFVREPAARVSWESTEGQDGHHG